MTNKIDVRDEVARRVRTAVHGLKEELRNEGISEQELDTIVVDETDDAIVVNVNLYRKAYTDGAAPVKKVK